jgi:hypothetical protein
VRPTGGDTSHQNAPGECPHQTIGYALRTMLHGDGVPFKYWPFAFRHSIMFHNALRRGSRGVPNERNGGKSPNLRDLRPFGCRVALRPPGPRPSKLENHANVRWYLGYTVTMTQAYYLDELASKVKTSSHARFYEGITDTPKPPPNARQLRAALGHPLPPPDHKCEDSQ